MDVRLAARMDELRRHWETVRKDHPRLVLGVAASLLLIAVVTTVSGVWFLAGLRNGLPDQAAMRRIGEMDQATAVFDQNDRLAFTIFKEQRIDVPLSQVSPNLTKAIASRRRRSPTCGTTAARKAAAPSPSSSRVRAS
jgi:membrane peptidoglycan carboxypeptidase